MIEINESVGGKRSLAQAKELSLLVDIEACWENMRGIPRAESEVSTSLRCLQGKQKAYDAFRAKLAAYNRQYTPLHVPELLLNTPCRLAIWCRKMRDLYLQIEHDIPASCPEHLLAKAHRWANRIGRRLKRACVSRMTTPPGTIRDAIQELEALAEWCESAGTLPG